MKTAVIIHGMPSKENYYDLNGDSQSNCHWLPWLQKQLSLKDIVAQTPEMPKPYEPNYEEWCQVFGQFKIDENTILVGHSCGGGFLVRWLSENKVKVGKVVLVAPWINYFNDLEWPTGDFFKFDIDVKMVMKTDGMVIFGSDNDDKDVRANIEVLRKEIKDIQFKEFHYGHFTLGDMGTREFPELLEEVLK